MIDDAAPRMDSMYRHQRHIYDVSRRFFLLGRRTLIDGLKPPDGGTVLEFGCGTAANLVLAAKLYPAQFFGFDISAEMLKTASGNVAKAGVTDRVAMLQADATTFDGAAAFGKQHYDRVFTSYTLSMIPDWPIAIERMVAAMAPNGSLHFVDFGDCAELPVVTRKALYAWLAKFHVTPRLTLEATLRACSSRHGLILDYAPLFRGYAQHAILRRG